jgi:Skp family chaperone for outer membrane proteins
MRRHIGAVLGLVGVAFAAGAVVGPRPTVATDREQRPAPRVGFVHLPKILADARKAKKLTRELNEWRTELAGKLTALRAEVDEKQKAVTTVRFDGDEKRRLETDIVTARRRMEDLDRTAQRDLADRSQKIVAEIYKDLHAVAAAVAKEHGLEAVLLHPANPSTTVPAEVEALLRSPAAAPLFIDNGNDFTAEVLKRLDAKFDEE